jgi:glucokinase
MKKIMTADIGGTNSRFGFFNLDNQGQLYFRNSIWFQTADYESFPELLQALTDSHFDCSLDQADISIFAVAGPVEGKVFSSPPLIPWNIDVLEAQDHFKLKHCQLINDFIAHAYSILTAASQPSQTIIKGKSTQLAPKAIIGAGTGLGKAMLMPVFGKRWIAFPSEGGHSSFSFYSKEELELQEYIIQTTQMPYVSENTLISGSGLSLIHAFLTGEQLSAQEISNKYPVASPTFTLMSRFYSRTIRNFALNSLALGGIYICGGIAAKNPDLFTHYEFNREFFHSPAMSHVLQQIPVTLLSNPESALWGAAYFAKQLLEKPDIP